MKSIKIENRQKTIDQAKFPEKGMINLYVNQAHSQDFVKGGGGGGGALLEG